MEEKKKINWLTVVVIILLVFAIGRIGELTHKLENAHSRCLSEIERLQNEISLIYDNVDEQLKKQASLLSNVDFSLGELASDNHTVPVELNIVPKNLTNDMQMSVRIGSSTTDFTRDGNEFTAIVPVSMFNGYDEYPMLIISTANGTKTELLESVDLAYLHNRYLPTLHADISGATDFSNGKLTFDNPVRIDCKPSSSECTVTFTKLELVTELNGEELSRKDITAELKNGSCETQFSESYDVTEGETLMIYAVAEDSLGYVHKVLASYWYENDGAQAEISTVTVANGEFIYDSEGNLLNG